MTKTNKKPQAAGLQTKKGRQSKMEKALFLSGLDRIQFEAVWNQLSESVRKKLSAAELAQLSRLVGSNVREKSVHRARHTLVDVQERFKRKLSRLPALPWVGDIKPAVRLALTGLVQRAITGLIRTSQKIGSAKLFRGEK